MTKNRNKKVKNNFINKKTNSKVDSFYIFGRKPILEQLKNKPEEIKLIYIVGNTESQSIKEIIQESKNKKIRLEYINQNTAISKIGKVNDQGVIAILNKYKYADQLE
jgi:tRNA G18 (ribose-2'-O)-methylase SpoU